MEAVGLGLAVLAEVRMIVKSLQERVACFKEEETIVSEACIALTRVNDLSNNITSVMETKQNIGKCQSLSCRGRWQIGEAFFAGILQDVEQRQRCRPSGSVKAKHFIRAKTISKDLLDVLGTANLAEGTLQHQLTQLTNATRVISWKITCEV